MDLHIIFIAIMFLVVAFIFVDVTGGKKPSPRMLQIYGFVFGLAGLGALISYLLTR